MENSWPWGLQRRVHNCIYAEAVMFLYELP